MNRPVQFLRSIAPEDPWQLAFLVGVVFVFVCGHAAWWPAALLGQMSLPFNDPQFQANMMKFRGFIILLLYPTIFSGVAGYFACFWPAKKPLRLLLLAVWGPAAAALTVYLRELYELSRLTSSVLHFKYDAGAFPGWLKANASYLPAGPAALHGWTGVHSFFCRST